MPIVIIAAFFLLRLSENAKIKGDSAIAIISSSSIAIGVIVNAASEGSNMDLNSYMFGSVLAMSGSDVYISVVLAIVVLTIFVVFYNRIFAITFDENFAKATGIKTGFYNTLLAVLTAVTIVVGMRIMGTMLISSLIIFPSLTSMRVFKNFKSVVISSGIISVICFIVGIIISYIYSFPTGACIVVANLGMFIIFSIIGHMK
jgi:zinc transport system permease protein